MCCTVNISVRMRKSVKIGLSIYKYTQFLFSISSIVLYSVVKIQIYATDGHDSHTNVALLCMTHHPRGNLIGK